MNKGGYNAIFDSFRVKRNRNDEPDQMFRISKSSPSSLFNLPCKIIPDSPQMMGQIKLNHFCLQKIFALTNRRKFGSQKNLLKGGFQKTPLITFRKK